MRRTLATLRCSLARLGFLLSSGHVASCPICSGVYDVTDLPHADSAGEEYAVDEIDGSYRRRGSMTGQGQCPVCLETVLLEGESDRDGTRWRLERGPAESVRLAAGVPDAVRAVHAEWLAAAEAYRDAMSRPLGALGEDCRAAYRAYSLAMARWAVAEDEYEGTDSASTRRQLAMVEALHGLPKMHSAA